MNAEQYLKHVNNAVSKEMYDYVINVALKDSRYLFVKKVKGIQNVYCTHCNKYFDELNDLKVNEYGTCKHCGGEGLIKSDGRGRSRLVDSARVIYYEKSVIDPKVMIAKVFEVSRDYRGEYTAVKTQFYWYSIYVFKMGDSVALERSYAMPGNKIESCQVVYKKTGGPFSAFGNYNYRIYCSLESLQNALKDTQFQYSTWERYVNDFHHNGLLKFFLLYSRYPCIEYLNKMGMEDIANAKIYSYNTCSAIDWNGKDIWKVLKINKNQFNELRKSSKSITPELLRMYQLSLKSKSPLTIDEVKYFSDLYSGYLSHLSFILKYTSLRNAVKYVEKQFNTLGRDKKKVYYSIRNVFGDYKDYINDCITLGMNLNNESVVLPKNLYNAHQNTIKQVKIKADKELDKKFKKRVKELDKYTYGNSDFIIRAVTSSNELIDEGKALIHCVGTYASRHANGETSIFVIRKKIEIDKPFYTLELKGKEVIQVRGMRNEKTTEEVQRFVNEFKSEKLSKRRVKKLNIAS